MSPARLEVSRKVFPSKRNTIAGRQVNIARRYEDEPIVIDQTHRRAKLAISYDGRATLDGLASTTKVNRGICSRPSET